jgi:hypothetical protein
LARIGDVHAITAAVAMKIDLTTLAEKVMAEDCNLIFQPRQNPL